MIKTLNFFQVLWYKLTQWRDFALPPGELIDCYKDRTEVTVKNHMPITWGPNETNTSKLDPGKVGTDGVGQGTPMQLGRNEYRSVTWGSGYGRVQQLWTKIPLPALRGRYWITGYPKPKSPVDPEGAYDRRCIIMDPEGRVHELIQFDQDAPVRPAGLPQQALNRGMWKNGVLLDGVPTTAANLPSHAYVWGPGSMENPHVQAFTLQDYVGGDGTDEFAEAYPDGPVCGEWYYLPDDSPSYLKMVAKGGQCEARAKAMNKYGVRLIDRGGRTSVLTQAGSWADATNIRDFTIDINDLRYAR